MFHNKTQVYLMENSLLNYNPMHMVGCYNKIQISISSQPPYHDQYQKIIRLSISWNVEMNTLEFLKNIYAMWYM